MSRQIAASRRRSGTSPPADRSPGHSCGRVCDNSGSSDIEEPSHGHGLALCRQLVLEARRVSTLVHVPCGDLSVALRGEAPGMNEAVAAAIDDLPVVATAVVA